MPSVTGLWIFWWRLLPGTTERNAKGERVYSAEQIRRLQVIRRLLDQGLRPGKVVPLSEEALGALAIATAEIFSNPEDVDSDHAQLIAPATVGDVADLNAALEQVLARDGLRTFVLDTFAPLSGAVGELWAAGRLQVFEEHLITRHLVRFLDVATSRLGRPPGNPEVLLATFPGERHSLGLLTVEALLWRSGKATLNLGADVPMDQVVAAVLGSTLKTVRSPSVPVIPGDRFGHSSRSSPIVSHRKGRYGSVARVFGACPGFRRR